MKLVTALAFVAFVAGPAQAQPSPAPPPGYGSPIGIEQAMMLIDIGMAEGAARKLKLAFAIVEPSGELVAFARMDDVPYASIRLAQQKARTSARLRISTASMEERVLGGRTALLSSDEVIAIGGGVPIIEGGKVVGALGISGGTAAEDAVVAEATISSR